MIHIPSRSELVERKKEFAESDKPLKKLFAFMLPTLYMTNIYPDRASICKDIKTMNQKLTEAGI